MYVCVCVCVCVCVWCVCVCVCVGGRGWGCLTEKRVTSVEELIHPPKAKGSITDCFPVSQSCTLRSLMDMQARHGLRRMRVTAQLHVESGQEGSDVLSPNTACPKQRHRLRKPSFPLRNRSCVVTGRMHVSHGCKRPLDRSTLRGCCCTPHTDEPLWPSGKALG